MQQRDDEEEEQQRHRSIERLSCLVASSSPSSSSFVLLPLSHPPAPSLSRTLQSLNAHTPHHTSSSSIPPRPWNSSSHPYRVTLPHTLLGSLAHRHRNPRRHQPVVEHPRSLPSHTTTNNPPCYNHFHYHCCVTTAAVHPRPLWPLGEPHLVSIPCRARARLREVLRHLAPPSSPLAPP